MLTMFKSGSACEGKLSGIGNSKKDRLQLMRAWSFHGKSAKTENSVKKKVVPGLSTGSLDGDLSEATSSRKAHLSESVVDSPDTLDRRLLKFGEKTTMASGSKFSKLESLKEKKKSYRSQKKEVAREIMNSASDKSFILMSDWLKVRGTLKGWTKLWCVCKPSMLLIYKNEKMKTGHWVGTILLNTCQLLQRPSKKEGFCFKLFHPLDQSIWATKGPRGETMGAFVQPLPVSYAIFRAPSENQGKCWMDGLELALRCTGLIKRAALRTNDITNDLSVAMVSDLSCRMPNDLSSNLTDDPEEEQPEHFSDDDDHSSIGMSESDFELAEEARKQDIPKIEETVYVCNDIEELGQQGDACQTEEVNEENKSLIWTLVKQVRPGMDLSKVVLPTFILEPRSFLDKLTDYYYHADILSQAIQQETALERMKMVVKWYLSGFYKKPKGLKKPYNPIIGETFRCYWVHPQTNSRTFYVAEQISHHPPISAFHVTNRQDGFNINGCILAKSKFYGNSISAILEGVATLTFLERGEDYQITMPYAHCKGILLGTLTMEMGGKVTLNCPKTGYHCDLDFKLKPFFGNGESANRITGCIRMGSEVLCTFEGHWDQQIYIKELTNRESVLFWEPSSDIRARRLRRYTVPIDLQRLNESERLWQKVSQAIMEQDMHLATGEKHRLEEKQRVEAKERHRNKQEWVPKWFTMDAVSNKWIYKHADARPWDPMTDCIQYEKDYIIKTQTVHHVPQVWQSPTLAAKGRIKTYNSQVTEDSYSSDNNAAESDDALSHNANRKSSVSTPNLSPEDPRLHQEKNSRDITKDFYKTSPKSLPKKLMFGENTSENKSKITEHDKYNSFSGTTGHSYSSTTGGSLSGATDHMFRKETGSKQFADDNRKVTPLNSSTNSLRSLKVPMFTARQQISSAGREPSNNTVSFSKDMQTLTKVIKMQHEMHTILNELMERVANIQKSHNELRQSRQSPHVVEARDGGGVGVGFVREWVLVAVILIIQTLLQWFFSR